jgi:hypothetical protein
MTTELPGFDLDGIRAWPEPGQPGLWRWLPGAPSPQLGPDGCKQISILDAGGLTMLQLGARWSAEQAVLDALPRRIAAAAGGGLDPSAITLSPADLSIGRVVLLLGPAGALAEAAVAHPSDAPPYAAALSAALTGDKAEAAKAALAGGKGRMLVRYEAAVRIATSAEASLSGDLAEALPGLATPDDDAAAITALDGLLAAGTVQMRVVADDRASSDLRARAESAVRERGAHLLRGLIDQPVPSPDRAGLEASARLSEPVAVPTVREADVAGWL